MPRSSTRSTPPARKEIDPQTLNIPAAFKRLAECLDTSPGAPRRIVLRYISNPAAQAAQQRFEDRTERICTKLIRKVIDNGATLRKGEVEWYILRAQQLQNAVVAGPDVQEGDLDFVNDLLSRGKLFEAVRMLKSDDRQPLECFQPRRARQSQSVSGAAPDVSPQEAGAAVAG